MSKILSDSDIFKEPFFQSLPIEYKLLWLFIWHDCSRAGIWRVDFKIARIYLNSNIEIEENVALQFFNASANNVIILDHGKKWFIMPYFKLNYPNGLQSQNRAHTQIISVVKEYGLENCINL